MPALDYAASDATRSSRRTWPARVFGTAILVALLTIFIPTPTVRQVESSMDAVTGSMTWKTTWIFGIPSTPRVDVSPLERRLVRMGAAWTPRRAFLHNTYIDLFDRPRGWECGEAPPIHTLAPLLQDFVAASTDEEVVAFVRTMESGSDDEQRAAVEAACTKTSRSFASSVPR
jgi:hypothetical protein